MSFIVLHWKTDDTRRKCLNETSNRRMLASWRIQSGDAADGDTDS